MEAGDTLKLTQGGHLWVVISDPAVDPDHVLIINMSTDRGIDPSCILVPGDHPFVRHPTCMRYDKTRMVTNADLDRRLASGQIRLDQSVSSSVLQRIRQGAAVSEYIAIGHREILVHQGLIEP